jgi:hypothetical protein
VNKVYGAVGVKPRHNKERMMISIMDGFNIWAGKFLFGVFCFGALAAVIVLYVLVMAFIVEPFQSWKKRKTK